MESKSQRYEHLRRLAQGNRRFSHDCTPLGDSGGKGLDYTSLIDHHDIISTHPGKGSERLMTLTPQKKKMLWLYNTGMDRTSWGFYNWRVDSVGCWEWHFCWSEDGSNYGYVNGGEWYNPFTNVDGFSPHAPAGYRGCLRWNGFQSGRF